MDRTKNNAFVQTWGDLDLQNGSLSDLCQAIDKKLAQGTNINMVGMRPRTHKDGSFSNEEYTLTDLVISQKLISRNAKDYERLDKLMSFLRSKGAKPACALKRKVVLPEQKILNELSFLKQREKVLSKALNQYRNR